MDLQWSYQSYTKPLKLNAMLGFKLLYQVWLNWGTFWDNEWMGETCSWHRCTRLGSQTYDHADGSPMRYCYIRDSAFFVLSHLHRCTCVMFWHEVILLIPMKIRILVKFSKKLRKMYQTYLSAILTSVKVHVIWIWNRNGIHQTIIWTSQFKEPNIPHAINICAKMNIKQSEIILE